ncbi:cytochrome c-type biogenesis protein [Rubrivivax albus]|uniref:Cytochrome c-type biogenesis protein n=1 Tax=Rubrivivax albus TaxID=2499835 RepID=A0A437K0J2_9BURK|nr:cytochrome c-type biogenesis protein [Rubrivivax albus]RVT53907.1 cytochrome c-type biogenesis protein CcmH [Rubrivivax albus]
MANRIVATLAAAGLACALATAGAQEARPLAADPALEAKVFEIAHDLRCLVCQNETIAASNADLAVDLRQQVREQLIAGRTPDEIRAYMVDRYGDFVLYKPPFKPLTWLLWIGPFVLLAAMAWVMSRTLRQRRSAAAAAAAPLSDAEARRARELLASADVPDARGPETPR